MDRSSQIRDRSRSAREHSRNLRLTARQLRNGLKNLRAYAGLNNARASHLTPSPRPGDAESAYAIPLTPLEFAALMRERACKARREAQALRHRAADLRNQAAEFRARSENLGRNSATLD
jgi:hypothetical protein